jgi:hypothetical protein
MQRCTVYFMWKLLYMFRVVPPHIIRSANYCIYSIWYLSHRFWRWVVFDDGWCYHPKHVEQFPDKINCVTLHITGYILEYSYDARTHERWNQHFLVLPAGIYSIMWESDIIYSYEMHQPVGCIAVVIKKKKICLVCFLCWLVIPTCSYVSQFSDTRGFAKFWSNFLGLFYCTKKLSRSIQFHLSIIISITRYTYMAF